MSFANTYFNRFHARDLIFSEKPSSDLFLSVVIPSYNENHLLKSLTSLRNCELPERDIEVIVVINSAENESVEIKNNNLRSFEDARDFSKKYSSKKMKFLILNIDDLPKKFAGVGLARKIGMDEALHRYNSLNMPDGLILGFDADSLVEKNYFTEIESYFEKHPKIEACSVHFEHPIQGDEFTDDIYNNITNYELHLRYFKEALNYTGTPFAYHTVGSSFAVRAGIYAMEGGMNRKKAGEDFYFLQKIIQRGKFGEINQTKVIPSPRTSDRVPFGTGAALMKMIKDQTNEFYTYNFEVFKLLKRFYSNIDKLYYEFNPDTINDYILDFLNINNFESAYLKMKMNSPTLETFKKRFYDWFNGFRLIKFVNFMHEKDFKKGKVFTESSKLLQAIRPKLQYPDNETDMLNIFRNIQIGLL